MNSIAANSFAILTDTTLCTGCEACVRACKEKNNLGEDQPRRWKKVIDDLSATRYTTIVRCPDSHYVRRQCRHCVDPACVSACLVGALKKTPEGPVIYDASLCMGCRYCMLACPYGVPRYEWSKAAPTIRKCDMCYDRLIKGQQPACTSVCPEKATIFGTRDELRAEAHRRIDRAPNKYQHKVFGEFEVGGTTVLYISDIPLGFLGSKPDMTDKPLPDLTWAAMKKIPPIILGVGGLMTGIWWIVGRRMKMQALAALSEESTANSSEDEKTDSECSE